MNPLFNMYKLNIVEIQLVATGKNYKFSVFFLSIFLQLLFLYILVYSNIFFLLLINISDTYLGHFCVCLYMYDSLNAIVLTKLELFLAFILIEIK